MDLTILKELQNFLDPLSDSEFAMLEKNCIANGILQAGIVWPYAGQKILVDGMHRYKISQTNNLEFKTIEREFEDIEAVKAWMIENQSGRRNISMFTKIELEYDAAVSNVDISNVRNHVTARLGLSVGAYNRAAYIIKNSSEEIKEKSRSGEISINQSYQQTRKKETPQDYNDKEKLINQIPAAFKADPRMISILYYFEKNKDRTDQPSHMQLAKEWRTHFGLTEDNLPTDTIVKSYVRLRDSIRKDESKILKYIN